MVALVDFKKNIQQLRDSTADIAAECDNKTVDAFVSATDEVLSKSTPCMMFYGLYNAGKSSIINAITGKKIAEVGDIPTTQEVQSIQWEGYTIVDTPGLNAKTEHTLTADAQIDKSDIVLFVIDDMNVDERSFYHAFVKVLKKDKPTMIVINQKNADYSISESNVVSRLKEQIVANIRYAADSEGLVRFENKKEFMGIIPVNAITAWQAWEHTDNEAVLYQEDSNIVELIKTMQSALKASSGVRMLIPALDIIKDKLSMLSDSVKSTLQSDGQKLYYHTRDNIYRQKENLYNRLMMEGRAKISSFSEKAAANAINNIPVDAYEIKNQLEQTIKNGFNDANVSLQNEFDLYRVNVGDLAVKIDKSHFELNIPKLEDNKSDDGIFDGILSFLEDVGDLLPVFSKDIIAPTPPIPPIPDKKIIAIVFKTLQSLFNKKKAEENKRKEIEEIREKIDEYNKANEERVNSMVNAIISVNQQIRSEMSKLEESYASVVSNLVETAYQPVLASLDAEMNDKELKAGEAETQLAKINLLLSECNSIRTAINDSGL